MPRVRIFLCTHRRPLLLRRALASLLAQTFTDWVCELHNDAPDDDSPRALLAELAPRAPRISLVQHTRNWGPVAVFNHAFAGGPEPYATILEDDNWWDSTFLERTLCLIDREPAAALVWANLRLWQEAADGSWSDTGRTIWPAPPLLAPERTFTWPELLQTVDSLHSNGAMLFRPDRFSPRTVPAATPFAIIEQLRERAARGPLLLIPEPLANFALTLSTARGDNRVVWLQSKLLVAASFFAAARVPPADLAHLWQARRDARPRDTDLLFLTALALRSMLLLSGATWFDAVRLILSALRHPITAWHGLHFRRDHPEVWAWLVQHSLSAPSRCTVLRKQPETAH